MNHYKDLQAQFRPIITWPGVETKRRRPAPFTASWSSTLELLKRELRMLQAKNVVIQVAIPEHQLRNDGYPYANAQAFHPGVILAFDSVHGPLRYPSDRFSSWEDNIRAIALSLEKLRAVDRYGVTRRAEQYAGWKAIAAPGAEMTPLQAAHHIAQVSGAAVDDLLRDPEAVRAAYRDAARKLHPDMGHADPTAFQELSRARDTLERYLVSGAL